MARGFAERISMAGDVLAAGPVPTARVGLTGSGVPPLELDDGVTPFGGDRTRPALGPSGPRLGDGAAVFPTRAERGSGAQLRFPHILGSPRAPATPQAPPNFQWCPILLRPGGGSSHRGTAWPHDRRHGGPLKKSSGATVDIVWAPRSPPARRHGKR